MTGLLDGLRAQSGIAASDWQSIGRLLATFVPGAEVATVVYFPDGRVSFRARAPMADTGRAYVVVHMDGYDNRRADGAQPIRMGAGRYADECDVMYYERPFVGWTQPTPAGIVAWLAGILLSDGVDSDRRGSLRALPPT
jgi:hypothetical protein